MIRRGVSAGRSGLAGRDVAWQIASEVPELGIPIQPPPPPLPPRTPPSAQSSAAAVFAAHLLPSVCVQPAWSRSRHSQLSSLGHRSYTCCCLPGGVVSIVYASKATPRKTWEISEPPEAANLAKTWLIVAVVGGLLCRGSISWHNRRKSVIGRVSRVRSSGSRGLLMFRGLLVLQERRRIAFAGCRPDHEVTRKRRAS